MEMFSKIAQLQTCSIHTHAPNFSPLYTQSVKASWEVHSPVSWHTSFVNLVNGEVVIKYYPGQTYCVSVSCHQWVVESSWWCRKDMIKLTWDGGADWQCSEICSEFYGKENRWGQTHILLHLLIVSLFSLWFIWDSIYFQYTFPLHIGFHLSFLQFGLNQGARYIKHIHIYINRWRLSI